MSKVRQLTKRQLEVIEDLFESDKKESEILKKHNLSRIIFNKWLSDKNFADEFDRRIAAAQRRTATNIALGISKAIENLVDLSGGEGETARKACLDIITLQNQVNTEMQQQHEVSEHSNSPKSSLSDEEASRILAALAQENRN
jgi:hypothetical protein